MQSPFYDQEIVKLSHLDTLAQIGFGPILACPILYPDLIILNLHKQPKNSSVENDDSFSDTAVVKIWVFPPH